MTSHQTTSPATPLPTLPALPTELASSEIASPELASSELASPALTSPHPSRSPLPPALSTRPLALVTGASSGIGLELAKQFASHGYDVILVAKDDTLIDAAQAVEALGTSVQAELCDLTIPTEADSLASRVLQDARRIDACALNAEIDLAGAFADQDLARIQERIDLDISSTTRLTHHLVSHMLAQGGGDLLFTSQAPGPSQAVDAAIRAYIHSFSQALRTELASSKISVTSFLPTSTDPFDRPGMSHTPLAASKHDPALVAQQAFEDMEKARANLDAAALTRNPTPSTHVLPDSLAADVLPHVDEPSD